LPDDGSVRYVQPGAASGDGTRALPFGRIDRALLAAPPGTIVALGAGTYDEVVVLPRGVILHGACPAETIVGTPAPVAASRGRITAAGEGAEVRNLRVVGSRPGLWVNEGASLLARDVIVEGTAIGGATALGRLEGDGLVIRDVAPGPGGVFGRGVHAEGAGQIALRRSVIERAREVALFARGPDVTLELDGVAVVDTQAQLSDELAGVSLIVAGGAEATVARSVFEGGRSVGVNVGEAGTVATFESIAVRGTETTLADGHGGTGIFVADGAVAEISGALVEQNRYTGLVAYLEGAVLRARDVVVRDAREREGFEGGAPAASVTNGGRIELERAYIARMVGAGVGSGTDGGDMALTDVVIVDTAPVTVDGQNGAGVILDFGATAVLERVLLEANHTVGFYAGEGVVATVRDLAVRDGVSQRATMRFGRGVELAPGSRVTLERARIEQNRSDGVFVWGPDAELTASDIVVESTRAAACAEVDPTCPSGGFGVAVWNGTASMTRFLVDANALAGVQVARASTVTLAHGTIARHPIGLHVQEADFSPDRDLTDVRLVDNERNYDADVLPIPQPSAPGLAFDL
jgi:hypothetical protein